MIMIMIIMTLMMMMTVVTLMMMMMTIMTLMMMMMTRAGKAVANFTLNVVVPVPPKPPQDVVEERFQKEYLIAIGVAAVIVRYNTAE